MTNKELGLDEELNENLDFLEDDEAHLDHKGNATLPYKAPSDFSNLPKQILMIIIVGLIITIIIWTIMHSKKKNHAINIPTQTKQIPTTSNSNLNSKALIHTNNNQNQNIQATHQDNPLPVISTNQEINQDINKDINKGISKDTSQLISQTLPPSQIIQNNQTEILKPSQTTTYTNNPINNQLEQKSNSNLTWQELQKSIINENTQKQNIIKHDTNNNLEISVPVGGFEKTPTTNQIIQSQASYNYKAEENIQELKNIINNITEELTANINQIKELQSNLRDISRSISNVSSSVSGVDAKILNLTNTVDNLSMDVKNVKKYIQEEDLDLTANLKPSEQDLFSNTPEYVVHAVIPGRAWLKSSSGQIITVTEGDSLGDYGKIALIDAANNIVRTSSGVVFR